MPLVPTAVQLGSMKPKRFLGLAATTVLVLVLVLTPYPALATTAAAYVVFKQYKPLLNIS